MTVAARMSAKSFWRSVWLASWEEGLLSDRACYSSAVSQHGQGSEFFHNSEVCGSSREEGFSASSMAMIHHRCLGDKFTVMLNLDLDFTPSHNPPSLQSFSLCDWNLEAKYMPFSCQT